MPTTAHAFPIIPLDDEREPTEAERLDLMTAHVHDVVTENARLRRELAQLARDNRSLQSRTRTMTAALIAIRPREAELSPEPVVIGVYDLLNTVGLVIAGARRAENQGDVPCIRFVRNANHVIVGVELAVLASEERDDAPDEYDPTHRVLASLALVGRGERA